MEAASLLPLPPPQFLLTSHRSNGVFYNGRSKRMSPCMASQIRPYSVEKGGLKQGLTQSSSEEGMGLH